MSIHPCRRASLSVLRGMLLLGVVFFSLVSCVPSAQAPVAVTVVVTVNPVIITVEVPVTVTPEPSPAPAPTAVPPPTFGNWMQVEPMAVRRAWHTMTVLQDGRVLIVGGYTAMDTDATNVEIFNPATNTYAPTGSLHTGRHSHTATLLPDGRVLVVGGYGMPYQWLSDAEIYDPVTGQWTVTQSLFPHGVSHTATLLNDGRVLVFGGNQRSGPAGPDDRVEIFDPETNQWKAAAPHYETQAGHTATLLTDGRVLIAGGSADPAIYDPVANSWQPAGQMVVKRWGAQAVRLNDGRVLVVGGVENTYGTTVLNSVEIYDPFSNTWQSATPMSQPRYLHTATLLPDGRVIVVGGWSFKDGYENALLNTAEIYDDERGFWTTLAPLTIGRASHATALLPDGRILVTGGETRLGTYLASAEVIGPFSTVQAPAAALIPVTSRPSVMAPASARKNLIPMAVFLALTAAVTCLFVILTLALKWDTALGGKRRIVFLGLAIFAVGLVLAQIFWPNEGMEYWCILIAIPALVLNYWEWTESKLMDKLFGISGKKQRVLNR